MSTLADIELDISQELRASEVYEELLPAILDLPRNQVMRVTAQVQLTVTIVLGFLPRIATLRKQIATQLPDFNLIHIDNLERLALALSHAQALRTEAIHPTDALLCLRPEALRVRRLLLGGVRCLIGRDVIARTALRKYSGQTGFEELSEDLGLLTSILLSGWQQLQGSAPFDRSELDHALALDMDIRRLLAMRKLWVRDFHSPDDIVAHAFTLLMRSYKRVRAAVQFVRARRGDADAFAPSIHAKRSPTTKRPATATPHASAIASSGEPSIFT